MELTLEKSDLYAFLGRLGADYELVAPVSKQNRFVFETLESPADAVLDYDTTLLPPVKSLFPYAEKLIEFSLKDMKKARPVLEHKKLALVFIHPCDINAINIMDEVQSEEPEDVNYTTRRSSAVIIGYECPAPCRENILCYDKGYHRADSGFDIYLTDTGARFHVRVSTKAGGEITRKSGLFKDAAYGDRAELLRVADRREAMFTRAVRGDINHLSERLKQAYEDVVWAEEGEKCLSCGACNVVCPTCYCYDTTDDLDPAMNRGARCRRWDGCQLEGFAKVSSGENFREGAAERLRHRVFKKEVYLKKRYGRSGCVGCGRCIEYCIADISIIAIFNRLLAGGPDADASGKPKP